MAERDLIRAFERILRVRSERVLLASGDDAAVVRAGGVAVTSVDAIVEGVHFELDTHSPGDVGHKALAASLSDLAAMGAEPGEAYVVLGTPASFGESRAIELVEAMESLAERSGVTIAGGDVIAAPAGGERDLTYRQGAEPGHLVGVTGALGGSMAGLLLLRGADADLDEAERDALLLRHRRPEPQLAVGAALTEAVVGAMIDVSDGIAADAGHIAERSGVSVEVRLGELPLAAGVEAVARRAGRDPLELAASGGDDYELLFTAAPDRRETVESTARAAGATVTWVGSVSAGAGVRLVGPDGRPVELSGYEHP